MKYRGTTALSVFSAVLFYFFLREFSWGGGEGANKVQISTHGAWKIVGEVQNTLKMWGRCSFTCTKRAKTRDRV